MKHTLTAAMLMVCTLFNLNAQTGYSDAGARSNSMGNASVTLQDVFSAQNNQAAMAFIEAPAAGISTQNYFLVEGGISSHYGVFAMPVQKAGVFGLSANYTGDNTFNQTKIGLGYGRKLAENVAVGLQLDYVGTKTSEVGSGAAFTFDIGVLYQPNKVLSIGAKVFNPVRAKNNLDFEEELPSIINVGFAYQPSEKIVVCIEGEQNLQDDLRIKSGVEYHIIDQLYLRAGYLSNPSMFTTGIGLKIKTLQLDLSSQFHQQLGVTPGLGIRYEF